MFAAQGTWDAILVAELEKNISQTRGAIFYFNKNKSDLFVNMIDELFFPVFALSDNEKARLAVFNVIIQAQKHYTGFSAVLKAAMENELSFIAEHTGRNEHVLLSYNDFLAQNIGGLFVKSLEVFQENRVLQL